MDACRVAGGAALFGQIVWLDFTKHGRVQQQVLNKLIETLRRELGKGSLRSCGFVICPALVSGRLLKGLRAEIRRVAVWS